MQRSPLLPLHATAGARIADRVDPPQLLTYGDVPAEYRAAQEGCAVFDTSDAGLVLVGGTDASDFLHRLLANAVRPLEPDEGNASLLLDPKGKVLHAFELAREADGFRLATPPGDAAGLAADLDRYLFAEAVTIEDATETTAPLAVVGPRAHEIVRSVSGVEPPAADRATARGTFGGRLVRVRRAPYAGSPGLHVDAGPETVAALWDALRADGAMPAGVAVRDILRVEACAALPGADVDPNVYPQEARLEGSFSLDKGCYIGQEVVAKIDTYGGLNKRLVPLRVDHDDPVPRGTRLYREEKGEWRDLGIVTSWAYSFVLDTGLALAYVKRRHQAPGTELRVGEGPARATVLHPPVRENAVPVTGEVEGASA